MPFQCTLLFLSFSSCLFSLFFFNSYISWTWNPVCPADHSACPPCLSVLPANYVFQSCRLVSRLPYTLLPSASYMLYCISCLPSLQVLPLLSAHVCLCSHVLCMCSIISCLLLGSSSDVSMLFVSRPERWHEYPRVMSLPQFHAWFEGSRRSSANTKY